MGHLLEVDDGECWTGQLVGGGGGSDRCTGQPAGADGDEEERDWPMDNCSGRKNGRVRVARDRFVFSQPQLELEVRARYVVGQPARGDRCRRRLGHILHWCRPLRSQETLPRHSHHLPPRFRQRGPSRPTAQIVSMLLVTLLISTSRS